jgi:hypothetical protein
LRLANPEADQLPVARATKRSRFARQVDDDALSSRLETAYGRMTKVLALTIPERETIVRGLDAPQPGLEELRAVLLRERVGRVRNGLV